MTVYNTIEEQLEVVKAIGDGKKVECLCLEYKDNWTTRSANQPPNFFEFKYRVKRVPREWYINVYPNADVNAVYSDMSRAIKARAENGNTIKVREVLDHTED